MPFTIEGKPAHGEDPLEDSGGTFAIERLHLDALSRGSTVVEAWVFHESSACLPQGARRGCVNFGELVECLGHLGRKAEVQARMFAAEVDETKLSMYTTFIDSTVMSLTAASQPPRRAGHWFVLLRPLRTEAYPEEEFEVSLAVEALREDTVLWRLFWSTILMSVVSLLGFLLIDVLYLMMFHLIVKRVSSAAHPFTMLGKPSKRFCRLRCDKHDRSGFVWRKLFSLVRVEASFGAILGVMVFAFMATAMQFALRELQRLAVSGNRDLCYFNEKCYYPTVFFDGSSSNVPVNNMISHIPYFIAGIHLVLQVIVAEDRLRTAFLKADKIRKTVTFGDVPAPADSGSLLRSLSSSSDLEEPEVISEGPEEEVQDCGAAVDMRIFHAMAMSFMACGMGSMAYHACPTVNTFQFDTSFMIPIMHLCTCVFVDFGTLGNRSTCAVRYFLGILGPIWVFNFIYAWFDSGFLDADINISIHVTVATLLVIWTCGAVQAFDVVFIGTDLTRVSKRRLFLKFFVIICAIGAVSSTPFRLAAGGMANIFLLVSVFIMFYVIGFDLVVEELLYHEFRWNCWCGIPDIALFFFKYPQLVILAVLGPIAMLYFTDKVALVSPGVSPAESHQANQPCILIGAIDAHDLWHCWSAIALGLWGMILLDAKVHAIGRVHELVFWLDRKDEAYHGHVRSSAAE